MTEKIRATKPESERQLRGRPRVSAEVARPNRVVTFVTNRELEFLEQVAVEEERSLAFVVHRIIAAHMEAKQGNV